MKPSGHPKHMVPFFVLILVPYILVSIGFLSLSAKNIRLKSHNLLWKEAKNIESLIHDFFWQRKTELLFLNHLIAGHIERKNLQEISNILSHFVDTSPIYESIWCFDHTARLISSTRKDNHIQNPLATDEHISQVLKHISQLSVDDIRASPIFLRFPSQDLPAHFIPTMYLVSVISPRQKSNQKSFAKLGVTIVRMPASHFLNLFATLPKQTKEQVALIDAEGTYLFHPISSKEWGKDLNTQERIQNDFSKSTLTHIFSEKPGSFEETTTNILGISLPLPVTSVIGIPLGTLLLTIRPPSLWKNVTHYGIEITFFLMLLVTTIILTAFFYVRFISSVKSLEQLRTDFVAMLSHDLKSPLATIKLTLDLLAENKEEKIKTLIQNAKYCTDRMFRLIYNFLDFSKYSDKKMVLERKNSDIRKIAEKIVKLFGYHAQGKGLHLILECPNDLPMVQIDAEKVERAITNLVDNALKFTPRGGTVTIQISFSPPDSLSISVSDTGSGIPKTMLPVLFQKYSQASGTGKMGTGLGLAIVKEVANAHGGDVTVESNEGKGTTFHLYLKGVSHTLQTIQKGET